MAKKEKKEKETVEETTPKVNDRVKSEEKYWVPSERRWMTREELEKLMNSK